MTLRDHVPIGLRLTLARLRRISGIRDLLGRYGAGAVHAYVDGSVRSNRWRQVALHKDSQVHRGSTLHVNEIGTQIRIVIGERAFIGERCFMSAGERIEISDDCLVGAACSLLGAGHTYDDPTLSYAAAPVVSYGTLLLQPNVWLGTGTTVVGGITIGFGSIIGAGSLVRAHVPPLCLAAGSPARIVRLFDWPTRTWRQLPTSADHAAETCAKHQESLPHLQEFLDAMAIQRRTRR